MENATKKRVQRIQLAFHNSTDFVTREITYAGHTVYVMFLLAITDSEQIYQSVITPIQDHSDKNPDGIIDYLQTQILYNNEVEKIYDETTATDKILKGNAIILVDNDTAMLSVNVEKITVRAIDVPPTSTVIKGPREGFNESLKMNISLIRRRMATSDLVIKYLEVGKYTKTQVAVTYLDSIADKKVVSKIISRIKEIDIDGVVDSYYISSYLNNRPYSMFKQVGDTEKPDILCAKMLEGRVGIVVDGSPIVLTLPFVLVEELQDSDDYYHQHYRVWFLRIIRLIGIVMAVLLPGTYVALQLYHYKIIPVNFLITILNTTSNIPFNPFSEVCFIVILFEILYEANIRMPQYLGLALSIVGALILGDTAVSAGLVSPPAVMIVALSGLTFYIVPSQAGQFSLLRVVFIFVGGVLGIYGILLGSVLLMSYLSSFDSYDSAYLAPLSPYIPNDQKDFIFKQPLQGMNTRPESIRNNRKNKKRQKICTK